MDLAAFSPLLETLSEGFIVVGRDSAIISMNRAAEDILGPDCEGLCRLPAGEKSTGKAAKKILKQTISAVRPQYLPGGMLAPYGTYYSDGKTQCQEQNLPLQRALQGETISSLEIVIHNRLNPDGVRLLLNASPVKDAIGRVKYAVCAFRDISAAHVSVQRDMIFRQVFAQTQEAIIITDAHFVVQFANQSYWELSGNSPDKILNHPYAPQQCESNESTSWEEMKNIVRKEGRWSGEFIVRRLSSELLPLWATMHSVTDNDSIVTNYVLTLSDITSLKSSQEELYRLISKDALTGLSNRREFFEQLEKTVDRASRLQEKFGLLSIDLQRFKELNDSLGHEAGDTVLQQVAARLTRLKKQDDAVGRLGGDEFAFIVSDCNSYLELALSIENIRQSIESPLAVAGQTVAISAAIGVAVYPDDGLDAATLAKNVDMALASAVNQKTGSTRFFTRRMTKNITRQFWLENNLRKSFGTSQLIPYFQPQLTLVNNKIEEAEVLIRWNHPEAGLISPGEFIPVAEQTGLINRVTAEIMDTSCNYLHQWKRQGLNLSRLSINISANLLLSPDFVSDFCRLIDSHGLSPSDILIEITESSAMDDPDQTGLVLQQLKNHGISLAIDDFGTGYSSLSYLKKFAVDQVKIDQSFVKDLSTSMESRTIVKAIIRMCETLGFETLAEGIETREQAMILAESGCKKLQGYLIAKPLSADEFQEFMHKHYSGLTLNAWSKPGT